jgi:hypothetical protein
MIRMAEKCHLPLSLLLLIPLNVRYHTSHARAPTTLTNFRLNTRKSLRSKAVITSTVQDSVTLSDIRVNHPGRSNAHQEDLVTVVADDMYTYSMHSKPGV